MKKALFILVCLFCVMPNISKAEEKSWWDSWKYNASKAWTSDKHQIMLPVNAYHVRASYSDADIDRFNEMPWGLGLNRYYNDELGNTHSFYAIVFTDSHKKAQPMVGYSWQKNWHLDAEDDMSVGLGYSLLVTARNNNGYIPFPGALPFANINYKRFGIQTAWVPWMGYGYGNIFFTNLTWKL